MPQPEVTLRWWMREPMLEANQLSDLAKLHVGFGEGDALDAAHFGVGIEQQRKLGLQRNFEGVFAKGALPTVDVGLLVGHHDIVALCATRRLWQ